VGGDSKRRSPYLDAGYSYLLDLVAEDASHRDAQPVVCELLSFPGNVAETAEDEAGDSLVIALRQVET